MLTTHRIARAIVACVIACGLAAPVPAMSRPQDDHFSAQAARDSAPTSSLAGTTSPDQRTIDQALAQERYYDPAGASSRPAHELRSPDTVDAAAGRGTFNSPDVTVVKVPQSTPTRADRGVDWADAGVGAAILFGAIAVGLAGATAIVRRRRPRTATAA